ncbi:MAG: hypothetical protein U1F53_00860 [Burkholderiaceae bacterium]
MSYSHAVVWTDHQHAQVLRFDAEHVQASKVKAHTHHTAQHGSSVRTEHEFFGQLCDEIAGIAEVLVVGPRTGIDAFQHYVGKHRAQQAKAIVGYEVADHPTENQLVAQARHWFLRYDRMAGNPTPT